MSLFQMQQGKLTPLVSDLGGELRWQSGGLIVFNPERNILTRLINLPEGVTAP